MLEIEKFIPRENFYVALLFDEGYWMVKILRKQQLTVKMPFDFGNITNGDVSGWTTPTDAVGRFHLEPQEEETLYQFFTGISPSQAKLYLQYTQREDRMSLIAPRPVPGVIGFWDGEVTSYHDPSPCTELWSVHDLVPYFNMENPHSSGVFCNTMDWVPISTSFWITPFTYQVIRDTELVKRFLRGERRCTVRTMGDGHRPIKAPAWLKEDYQKYMIQPEEV